MVRAAGLPVQGFVLRYQDWGEVTSWALAALVVCEVGLDQLHAVVGGMRRAALVGVVEDGGAMLVLSASVAVVLALFQRSRAGTDQDGRPVAAGVSG